MLEHLSSWGFVIIANHEGISFKSIGVIKSLKIILNLNSDKNGIFYNKIDLDNIGLNRYSAGSAGILYYTILDYEDEF